MKSFFCTNTNDIYLLAKFCALVWAIHPTFHSHYNFWFRFFWKIYSKSPSLLPFYTY